MPRLPSFAELTNLDLDHWREHDHIWTDSLWLIEERDRTGAHSAGFHGNFVPQIPNQFIQRYTKPGEWVIDPFVGSGTTLIEAARLGRNSVGIDVNPLAVEAARSAVDRDAAEMSARAHVIEGDSRSVDLAAELQSRGSGGAALAILHPPYHDIISFSADPRDLSNSETLEEFLQAVGEVVSNTLGVLGRGRMMAIVIGDKYAGGEWVPLGWHVMSVATRCGLQLKSIVVKNFTGNTAGKRSTGALWRYRALRGGFYVFRHEYILVLRKAT